MNYIILKIKNRVAQNMGILRNFSYLSLLQVFTLILPLMTYPYLIRVLGKEIYGVVIYAVSLASYFSILVNFGFNIYATKYVSIYRDNKNKMSEVVSNVLTIKILLFIVSFVLFHLLLLLIPSLRLHYVLYLFSFLVCINEVIFPVWYFQGIEKMKHITYINIVSRLLFTILIFLVIKTKSDFLYVPMLQFLGAFVSGVWALWIVFKRHTICFNLPRVQVLKKYFRESFPFFLSRASSVVNTESNTILIGIFLTMSDVAYYDLAKKIIALLLVPFNLLNQAIYPSVAKSKDMSLVKIVMKFNFILGIFIYVGLVMFGKTLISILGGTDLAPTYNILLVMAFVVPINGLTYFLGNTVLVVMGYSKYFNLSVVYAMIFYSIIISIATVLFPITVYLFAYLFVLVGVFDLVYRGYYVRKYNLLNV